MIRQRTKSKEPIIISDHLSPLLNGKKMFIGIDPGKTGFICEMNNGTVTFHTIPKIGKQVDLLQLSKIIQKYQEIDCHCVIEDVHAVFGSAAKSTFEFGRIVGNLESFLVAFRIPYTEVAPKKWQKEMWEGVAIQKKPSKSGKKVVTDTKKTSEIAAKRLFPEIDLRKSTRATNVDDNKVDSLLMAEYCRRKF